jgi:2-polyprenyl-3-methyl-5-hydroxy-6-metoxy-1,4-benzoquinol methylase
VLEWVVVWVLVLVSVVVLDFGCGEGELIELLSKKGYQVDGIDVAQINIDNAKKRLHKTGLDSKVKKGSLDDLEEKYDLIVMDNVIEHIASDEIKNVVKKAKEKLNENGQILIITPSAFSGPHDVSGEFLPIGKKAEGFHFKEYTVTELKRLFEEDGFKSVKTYFVNPTILNRLNIVLRPGSLSLKKSLILEKIFSKKPLSCLLKLNKKLSNRLALLMFPTIVVVKK